MRIEWNIKKKRGNLRPILTYSVILEEHEKALALPPLRVSSTIPEPQDSWQEYCYPGQMERASEPPAFSCYELESPSHRGKSWTQTLRLPWRANNSYPEVEESFRQFRDKLEAALSSAYASNPMDITNTLESSKESRVLLAPGAIAEHFLRVTQRNI